VNARREADADVARDVAAIIARVRSEGDAALHELTQRFDGHDLNATGWRIDLAQCRAAYEALEPDLHAALDLAAARIRAYHEQQRPQDSDA
ncbi:histidinol dehydrogenase, partial [Pseudomonas sp. MPR-R1B]|uniref:histidinol dehydrogenase n=1 Tax=Pseudomonas sp. MPR-R1B TaxID=2070678 RepID=UPI000CA6572E